MGLNLPGNRIYCRLFPSPSKGARPCDAYPSFVDTSGVQHAGNYTGHELRPDRPERVADAIVQVVLRPRDETSVGALAKLAPLAYAVAPGLSR